MTLASPGRGVERLSIGDVARDTGHTTVTIRHWERVGLLESPERRAGKRSYRRSVLTRIRLIDLARAAGFRLDEIRDLVTDRQPPMAPGDRWRALAAGKRAELDARAAAIGAMREVLTHLAACRCSSLDECATRTAPGGDR